MIEDQEYILLKIIEILDAEKPDAVIIAGDIYDKSVPSAEAVQLFDDFLCRLAKRNLQVFAISGNHDIRLRSYKKQLKIFNEFLAGLNGGIVGSSNHYYFSMDIKGYKFIILGADRTAFEASYISTAQLEFLESELKSADKTKPVFVLNHQPLRFTNGLPATWLGKGSWRGHVGRQSDSIREIFERYGNIFYITGHLHFGTSRYNFEDYGSFKALSLPTIGVLNHGAFSHNAQGYIISVYDDCVILKSRLFRQGKYCPRDVENSYIKIAI
jgi:3',5'-cyclic AMP phosphodiesterase CpdA